MKKVILMILFFVVMSMTLSVFANDNTVNWSKGDVTAIGVGYSPEGISVGAISIARRGAIADAQRNLLEITKGVQIDAETTVENMTVEEHLKYYLNLGESKQDAIKKVAKERGVSKNEVYQIAINL